MKEFPCFIFIDDSTIAFSITKSNERTEMSNGMAKIKPINSLPLVETDFAVSMNRNKLGEFQEWFKDIRFGASFFLLRDPTNGVTSKYRFRDADISWSKRGNLYFTTFRLESYYGN